MKIVVLNGSPKGEHSNTLFYMNYIMKRRPGHHYKVLEIGRDIKKIEKEQERFSAIVEDIKAADGIVWSFPVYHYTVPSQLMRFIEMLSERRVAGAFREKYAASLTTSAHFYDHLAHNYVRAVSEDLGMKYVKGFSAHMMDLKQPGWRRQWLLFFDDFAGAIEGNVPVERRYAPISEVPGEYVPSGPKGPVSIGDKRIVLVTDAGAGDVNLNRMVDTFKRSVDGRVDVVDLNAIEMAGGCLGCIRCVNDNVCVYRDGLRSVYYERLAGADAIVFAGSVRGRSLSSRWKMFWDRSFVNGHCPIMEGGQYGYIVSGPLRQLPDLREELETRAQLSNNNLAGIVTDEDDDPALITALIGQLAAGIARGMASGYCPPPTFLAVGGKLVFRDLVYVAGWLFRADDRYYKKHGLLDYPQKNYRLRLQRLILGTLMSSGRFRRMFYSRALQANAREYQKIIDAEG